MEELDQLQEKSKTILDQIERVRTTIKQNKYDEVTIFLNIEELCDYLKWWGTFATEEGNHRETKELGEQKEIEFMATYVRDFAVSLYNQEDQVEWALRVMNVLKTVLMKAGFATERFDRDLQALENEKQKQIFIAAQRNTVVINEGRVQSKGSKAGTNEKKLTFVIFFAGIALFFCIIGYGVFTGIMKGNLLKGENQLPVATEVKQTEQSKLANGLVKYFGKEKAEAPFTIKTPAGEEYYYVLFRDSKTGKAVASMFVYPSSVREMKMPLGDYVMYLAKGREWYGYKDLFGVGTKLQKADEVFSFYKKGDQVMGLTVDVNIVNDGNLKMSSADRNEFNEE